MLIFNFLTHFDNCLERERNSWSPCSVTCGQGIQARARLCEGTQCKGYRTESKACFMEACPGKNNLKKNVKTQTLKENTRLKTCVRKILRGSWYMLGNVSKLISDLTKPMANFKRLLFFLPNCLKLAIFHIKLTNSPNSARSRFVNRRKTQLLSWR